MSGKSSISRLSPTPGPRSSELTTGLHGTDEGDAQAASVLIIEDNVDSAESMVLLLELWGYDVRKVHSAGAALSVVLAYEPDIVLLDIGLPGMDGFEVAKRLRAAQKKNVLLIGISGHGDARHLQLSREAGMDHYLVKPADLDVLQKLLASQRSRSDLRAQQEN